MTAPVATIVSEPLTQAAPVGSNTVFAVSVYGNPPLSFQWWFNATNKIAGATNASLALSDVQTNMMGSYSVVVSNRAATNLSAPAFLSVVSQLTNPAGSVLAPSGLVNWWAAEGNPKDLFGTNDATPNGGFSYTVGKEGMGFHFDGASSYLNTGAASLAAPWTACMWVNRQNAPGPAASLMSDGTYYLKLEQYNGNLLRAAVELTKDWRTDRVLRHLEALMIAVSREDFLIISGNGDVIESDDNVAAIGSGGPYAQAAARALVALGRLQDAAAAVAAGNGGLDAGHSSPPGEISCLILPTSALASATGIARRRLRRELFLLSRCEAPAGLCMILPDPVTFSRLAVALCVFIFGIYRPRYGEQA